MKEIKFNLKENPFINFQSSRYSMSSRINVEKMWKYSKENDYSFFILSLGCLLKAVNSIPQLKRRIIDNKVIEYDYLDGVSPIMNKQEDNYKEMRVKPPEQFKDTLSWHDYVKQLIQDTLNNKKEAFMIEMEKRDIENIVNLSCIPWVDFDSITTCTASPTQIQPLITWGKVNENYEMTIAITVSHIFVNGLELGEFYKKVQENFNQLP
ncbi:CatA-like O-acetyltransferase [uncultured Methanobrevibacter sp.]|uniref:CatA-like O-acetyltransferase n=1 Tax=uncultured Methanobrevibacter sp. TaxID=253161 RepID=UPI00261B20DC|nr:CatA-like O-acetyltransferase [uncultured Methanobrevibacter sp.]